MGLFIIIALPNGPTRKEFVEYLPGVDKASVEQHEEATEVAFVGVLIVGAAALFFVILFRHGKSVPNSLSVIMLALSLIIFV